MHVGVISDTHDFLHPKLPAVLQGVDVIIHAGDIGSRRIYDQLQAIAPVHAVLGNTDVPERYPFLEEWEMVELEAYRIFIIHDIQSKTALIKRFKPMWGQAPPHLIVYGHTHIFSKEEKEKMLFLNPGSASKPKDSSQPSLALVELQEGKPIQIEEIRLT